MHNYDSNISGIFRVVRAGYEWITINRYSGEQEHIALQKILIRNVETL